jgi:hypothetical protein
MSAKQVLAIDTVEDNEDLFDQIPLNNNVCINDHEMELSFPSWLFLCECREQVFHFQN